MNFFQLGIEPRTRKFCYRSEVEPEALVAQANTLHHSNCPSVNCPSVNVISACNDSWIKLDRGFFPLNDVELDHCQIFRRKLTSHPRILPVKILTLTFWRKYQILRREMKNSGTVSNCALPWLNNYSLNTVRKPVTFQ